MRYSFVSAAVLALISSVVAQTPGFDAITAPTQDQEVPAGSSLQIVWEPETVTGTVTITLLQGSSPSTLDLGDVIQAGVDNTLGKYTWKVPTTASYSTYGFKISLDSNPSTFQYSFPFHISGGSSSSSSSSVPASTSSVVSSSLASVSGSTTTVQVATGTAYTSSSSSAVVTKTSTSTSASATEAVKGSSTANTSSSSAFVKPSPLSGSNSTTLLTTATTGSTISTGTSTATPVTGAAVAKIANGGLAMVGGLVLALAL